MFNLFRKAPESRMTGYFWETPVYRLWIDFIELTVQHFTSLAQPEGIGFTQIRIDRGSVTQEFEFATGGKIVIYHHRGQRMLVCTYSNSIGERQDWPLADQPDQTHGNTKESLIAKMIEWNAFIQRNLELVQNRN